MNLEDVIKNINDAKEQLQKSVDIKKSEEEDAEQQEEADKSVEPKTKEDADGHEPIEKSEAEGDETTEDDAEKSCGKSKKVAKSEDDSKDDESEDHDEESEDDDDEPEDAKKSCGNDKEVAKSDDAEDDEPEDVVEDRDQRTKSPNVAKSVFMQHLETFESLSKSYLDLANASIELAQSVLAKSIDAKAGQEVAEKSVDPEPEADTVEKYLPQGKSVQYANDEPEDDGIEKSVDDESVKVSELKDAVTKSIRGLQGYTLMTKEQGALKSLLHKVDELDPEDVAPEELVKAYNEI